MTIDGNDKIIHSADAALGDLTMRIHRSGNGPNPLEVPFAGDVSGRAVDIDVAAAMHSATPTTVTLAALHGTSPATVEGTQYYPDITMGRITGLITFSDNQGSGLCSAGNWRLQPRPQ